MPDEPDLDQESITNLFLYSFVEQSKLAVEEFKLHNLEEMLKALIDPRKEKLCSEKSVRARTDK